MDVKEAWLAGALAKSASCSIGKLASVDQFSIWMEIVREHGLRAVDMQLVGSVLNVAAVDAERMVEEAGTSAAVEILAHTVGLTEAYVYKCKSQERLGPECELCYDVIRNIANSAWVCSCGNISPFKASDMNAEQLAEAEQLGREEFAMTIRYAGVLRRPATIEDVERLGEELAKLISRGA